MIAQKHYCEKITDVFFVDTEKSTSDKKGNSIEAQRSDTVRAHTHESVKISQQRLSMNELAVGIPQVLIEQLKLAESPDEIVLDLTNGTKAISSLLYATGSLLQIKRLLFVNLTETGHKLKASELQEGEDYWVTQIDPLENISELGQLAYFDLVYYKNQTRKIKTLWPNGCNKLTSVQLETDLESAVKSFFQNDTKSAAVAIARIAENLGPHMCHEVNNVVKDKKEKNVPSEFSEAINFLTGNICNPIRKKLKDNFELNSIESIFLPIRNLDKLFDIIRVFRNDSAHARPVTITRTECKLALDIIMHAMEITGELNGH